MLGLHEGVEELGVSGLGLRVEGLRGLWDSILGFSSVEAAVPLSHHILGGGGPSSRLVFASQPVWYKCARNRFKFTPVIKAYTPFSR